MNLSVSPRLNVDLLEEKYAQWKRDPSSVDETWTAFFEGFELGSTQLGGTAQEGGVSGSATEADLDFRASVGELLYGFRSIGHTAAWTDPLSEGAPMQPLLSLESFGLTESDLAKTASCKDYKSGKAMPLKELVAELRHTYAGKIGFEFMHIHNPGVRQWLRERIEHRRPVSETEAKTKLKVFRWLMQSELFERFLHKKFPGEKRFSLEGGESLVVALNGILDRCPSLGIKEIVMGMAHRGRLNVLANFLGKSLQVLLYEFEENYIPNLVAGDGDVKYHLGYDSVRQTTAGEKISIILAANPSHLEAVNPVVEGKARARQRILKDTIERKQVLPLLLHGDAAFAGQGLVAEVLNLSQLPGYRTGGTVHIVVNNQIGFTTMPADARSSNYCTDVAKMIEAPIIHVNGDDPLEVLFAAELALDFRQTFSRDVVIDMVCYRRHGHNEGDEPEFTQPQTYRAIKSHPSVATLYQHTLEEDEVLTADEAHGMRDRAQSLLEQEYAELKELEATGSGHCFAESSAVSQPEFNFAPVPTGIALDTLHDIGRKLSQVPADFEVNSKIEKRFLSKRREAIDNGGPYNWAFAEALAFGSLLTEGTAVRLSGQDCRRGTFSQRHAVLYDAAHPDERNRYIPLQHLSENQARFCVYNSLLSEAAVLGFDYGYSLSAPEMLIMWEAQFGDFANGAQVIIDQFISSAESKWSRPSSIVLLLPHGYEGLGPEHSSARMERFLQLCAEQNMQVANLTTPAQYFHILRRQVKREIHKPLVLMTPKSLLGSPACVSYDAEFAEGTHFREILDDDQLPCPPEGVNRVIFCSGKVYFDLLNYRREHEITDTAIVRVEQLYPLHRELLHQIAARYAHAHKWVWCQEESLNMGAWSYICARLQDLTPYKIRYAGRDRSSSPAVGAKAIHKHEQKKLVEKAFTP